MKVYKVRERQHDALLDDMLAARGIMGEKDIDAFLAPDFERDSHDPFLLPGMDIAVERILSAKKNNEKVCVWSDYDCDGIPGGVMLTQFLRTIGVSVRHYIPHRHKEGYGLNKEGIDSIAEDGITLIITIDLGTTEHESILYAKEKGIDIIVTDHHVVQTLDNPALALINPKRPDSTYPFDGLCGAGVAWKLVQGILVTLRSGSQPFDYAQGKEKWFLDLVGIATLSDMVPLVGENRMLAHFGLKVLKRNRRPGLAALLKVLKIRPSALTEDDIGFMIGPRINAASRMDSPDIAAKLLSTEDEAQAGVLAKELNHINDERKGLVAATVKEANHRMLENPVSGGVIVMGNPKWRPGILGLVANKLAEAHHKPVFLWGREGGEVLRGSVRSGDGVSVVEIMSGAPEMFLHFGGHHASGGFSVSEENVHLLAAALTEVHETIKSKGTLVQEVMVERELSLPEVRHALRDLNRLAPFGESNRKPLFVFRDALASRVRMFGKQNDHLEVSLASGDTTVSGISFFYTPESFLKPIEAGQKIDVVGHVELDWKGGPRIRIVDVI
jgi:single-stranded-DNA-specific exonuclease